MLCMKDMVARAGWLVKTFHSFFDYWNGTKRSMVKTGKALAGWCAGNAESGYTSGKPLSLSHITSDEEKVDGFVSSLLGHKTLLDRDVKRLLVANGLRFYDDFVMFLGKDPG